MGAAVSNNVASATTEISNSIQNITTVNNAQQTSTVQSVNLRGCDIHATGDFLIHFASDVKIRNEQNTKVMTSNTLQNSVSQTVMQKAMSKLGSMGIGFASASNSASMFCGISNDIVNSVSQSSTQFSSTFQNFTCEDSKITADNVEIDFNSSGDFYNKQILRNTNVNNVSNTVTQAIKQTASATVEGLGAFLIALAILIIAIGYSFSKAANNKPMKLMIISGIIILIGALVVAMYMRNTGPFFNKPKICAVHSQLGRGDEGYSVVEAKMQSLRLTHSPIKYLYNVFPTGSPPIPGFEKISLWGMILAGDPEWGSNNAGYNIENMNTISKYIHGFLIKLKMSDDNQLFFVNTFTKKGKKGAKPEDVTADTTPSKLHILVKYILYGVQWNYTTKAGKVVGWEVANGTPTFADKTSGSCGGVRTPALPGGGCPAGVNTPTGPAVWSAGANTGSCGAGIPNLLFNPYYSPGGDVGGPGMRVTSPRKCSYPSCTAASVVAADDGTQWNPDGTLEVGKITRGPYQCNIQYSIPPIDENQYIKMPVQFMNVSGPGTDKKTRPDPCSPKTANCQAGSCTPSIFQWDVNAPKSSELPRNNVPGDGDPSGKFGIMFFDDIGVVLKMGPLGQGGSSVTCGKGGTVTNMWDTSAPPAPAPGVAPFSWTAGPGSPEEGIANDNIYTFLKWRDNLKDILKDTTKMAQGSTSSAALNEDKICEQSVDSFIRFLFMYILDQKIVSLDLNIYRMDPTAGLVGSKQGGEIVQFIPSGGNYSLFAEARKNIMYRLDGPEPTTNAGVAILDYCMQYNTDATASGDIVYQNGTHSTGHIVGLFGPLKTKTYDLQKFTQHIGVYILAGIIGVICIFILLHGGK